MIPWSGIFLKVFVFNFSFLYLRVWACLHATSTILIGQSTDPTVAKKIPRILNLKWIDGIIWTYALIDHQTMVVLKLFLLFLYFTLVLHSLSFIWAMVYCDR